MQADPQLLRTVLVTTKLDTKLPQFSEPDDLQVCFCTFILSIYDDLCLFLCTQYPLLVRFFALGCM